MERWKLSIVHNRTIQLTAMIVANMSLQIRAIKFPYKPIRVDVSAYSIIYL